MGRTPSLKRAFRKDHRSWFTVKRLTSAVYGIAEFNHPEEVISYLIVGHRTALLVDSGMGYANIRSVVRQITDLPITVYNTHSHFDHVGGNRQFPNVKRAVPGTTIHCDPFALQVIATPGHSKDSVCFFEPRKGWLFSGDTIYYGPIFFTWPDSSIPAYRQSVRRLIALPIKRIFPGHNTFSCTQRCLARIDVGLKTHRRIAGRISLGGRLALVAPD